MSNSQLLDTVNEAVKRADNLSELWAGTTTGSIIDSQKRHLESLVRMGDMNLASIQVLELVQSCIDAEDNDEH